MSNIEEDIKVLENYLKHSSYKEKENDFFKGSGWEVVDLDIPQAMANVLAEREADKKRIKELEEEIKKYKSLKYLFKLDNKENYINMEKVYFEWLDSIPVQKVKDKMKELSDEFEKINTPDNNEWYIDSDKYAFAIGKLEELLEDK